MKFPKPTWSTSTVSRKKESVPVIGAYARKIHRIWNQAQNDVRKRHVSNQGIHMGGNPSELSKKDIDLILEQIDPSVHTNAKAPPHTAEYYNLYTARELCSKFRRKSHREMDSGFRKFKKRKKFKSHNKKSLKNEGTKNVHGRTYRVRPRNSGPGSNSEGSET